MDPQVVTIILALITLAGTYITVKYKDYWKNKPKVKTPLELLEERVDDEIRDLRQRLTKAEDKADEALKLVKQKDEEILKLQRQISTERSKYSKLLRRFNVLKAKIDKKDKELSNGTNTN